MVNDQIFFLQWCTLITRSSPTTRECQVFNDFMFVFLNHDGGQVEQEDRGEDDEQNSLSKRRRVGVAMEKVEKCNDATKVHPSYFKTFCSTDDKKHRKNCECCPGHYLIVSHYSSMSE